jgi:RNA polymerase sigma factor (sigma-70 family)
MRASRIGGGLPANPVQRRQLMSVRVAGEGAVEQLRPPDRPAELEAEFEAEYRRNYPAAIRYARRMLEDREEADDVVDTVFLRLLVAMRRHSSRPLPSAPDEAQAMIIRAVRNEVLTLHRAKSRLARCTEDLAHGFESLQRSLTNPERMRHRRQLSELVHEAVQSMPKRCRETFILVHYEEMSYANAALVLGVAPGTVHAQLKKANRILKAYLLPYEPEEDEDWAPPVTSRSHDNDD